MYFLEYGEQILQQANVCHISGLVKEKVAEGL